MPESSLSIGDRIQKVPCSPSSCTRHDDQLVDLLLKVWRAGRFAKNPDWLSQSQTNVEVVASDASNVRIAIEHTRLFAYEDHKAQEVALRPIAQALEAEPNLNSLGRRFEILFQGHFLGRELQRHQHAVCEQLVAWAVETLPGLPKRKREYQFNVAISLSNGKRPKIPVHVDVTEPIEGLRSVTVGGYLPTELDRFDPIVEKALKDKLPKLQANDADLKMLLFELPIITETPSNVIETLDKFSSQFSDLSQVNYIAVVNSFAYESEGYLLYWIWDRSIADWSDIIEPVIR